jgi:hypothetical protein
MYICPKQSLVAEYRRKKSYENQEYYLDTTINNFERHNVKKYRIKEEWFFDKQRSVMEVRIIGICPVMDRFTEDGIYDGQVSLFWVYFPEARKILSKAEVYILILPGFGMISHIVATFSRKPLCLSGII